MMQRNAKIGALAIGAFAVVVLTVGCARSNYPLTAQERQLYMPVDRARIAKARDQKVPTIKAGTHLAAAKLLEQQGDVQKAIVQYRKAINSKNTPVEAYHRLGVLLSMLGKNEEAIKMLRRAVALAPDQPVLHNDLGFALTLQSQWEQAEREFRKAIAIERRFARAYINLGLTLSKMDRFEEAKAAFLAVLPKQDAYYNLGLMYRSKRRYAEASDAFHHVLDVAPEFSAASTQLEDIRDLVPTQSKSALPSPKENFVYQPIQREKTRLVRIERPNSTESMPQFKPGSGPSAFEEFFEQDDAVVAAPFMTQLSSNESQHTALFENDEPATSMAAIAPEPNSNRNNLPLRDILRMLQGKPAEPGLPGLIDTWTVDERNSAASAVNRSVQVAENSGERVSYLGDDEFVLTPAELAMSPIGEIVDEVSLYSVADDWSAWTHLNAPLMASSYSDEVSVSPRASLAVMGYDLREVQSEINCLEDELETRLAERKAREAVVVGEMLADATPDETFDWLLVRSPMVSPEPFFELENFMPAPPLNRDYVSLVAGQFDASVDIGRVWAGDSEVGSIPFPERASVIPCADQESRPTLASSIFDSQDFESHNLDSQVLESFLPDSDLPVRWSPLPMLNGQGYVNFEPGFPGFDQNHSDKPFAWVEQFASLDDSLSVLLNEARCKNNQRRLEELEPERLGYCLSDFIQACEPSVTDASPFLDADEMTKTTRHELPWLGSSTNDRGR